jgi:hypothetical protein
MQDLAVLTSQLLVFSKPEALLRGVVLYLETLNLELMSNCVASSKPRGLLLIQTNQFIYGLIQVGLSFPLAFLPVLVVLLAAYLLVTLMPLLLFGMEVHLEHL